MGSLDNWILNYRYGKYSTCMLIDGENSPRDPTIARLRKSYAEIG